MIQIDPRSRVAIYEQIIRRVEELVTCGILQKDEQLPSVRTLAGTLGINPNTIQKAYAILEQDGVIYSRQGRGSFIALDAHEMQEKRSPDMFSELDRVVDDLIRMSVGQAAVILRVQLRYQHAVEGGGPDVVHS